MNGGVDGEGKRQLEAALARVEAGKERPYYDAGADAKARDDYYALLAAGGPAVDELRRALGELLSATHATKPRYDPSDHVYPWVDLHPDRQLRSIYSGKAFAPEALIVADARIEQARTERLQQVVVERTAVGPRELEAEFDRLEAELPYNCEHVVPQSWFSKHEPMRGDVHHLFACESGCNSFRGNTPYGEFPELREVVREECGKREGGWGNAFNNLERALEAARPAS